MAQFKPVMVRFSQDLESVEKKEGQYIVVLSEQELYVDYKLNGELIRQKVSNNVYVDNIAPANPTEGDIWFETEE